ncbi:hypothetical protein [Oscillatoria sp. HE19RPO]|uniref:hypothetical protein n=1 Tax=Oscillatoria sp. HE19RPO TaxID=2954806 RepID=UPI0020C35411|nr:hypothetical protein [Oscillatoria sp. HE19RPO]
MSHSYSYLLNKGAIGLFNGVLSPVWVRMLLIGKAGCQLRGGVVLRRSPSSRG